VTVQLPLDVEEILERGAFCYMGTSTPRGPHVTPMVFAVSGGLLWVTTSRASVKARSWRSAPAVGGLVRGGDAAVTFTGRVRTYDLLDSGSWSRDVLEAPALTAAAARFTRKNARFFAGYAVDAQHVPLSWTPPGRVFASVELERAAVIGPQGVVETLGVWSRRLPSKERFRAARTGLRPLGGLPDEVEEAVGRSGDGALALGGREGVVVLPVRWAADGAAVYASASEVELGLAAPEGPQPPAALAIDRPSSWRARDMVGALLQGTGEIFVAERLAAGAASAHRIVLETGAEPAGSALVRLRLEQLVWWQGWSSGTVLE
jgi:hypothetical protein